MTLRKSLGSSCYGIDKNFVVVVVAVVVVVVDVVTKPVYSGDSLQMSSMGMFFPLQPGLPPGPSLQQAEKNDLRGKRVALRC